VAKQTTVTMVDDLDGGEADEQVEFSVDGRSYEIDLSAANSARLREVLAPYVAAARRTGGRRSGGSAGSAGSAGSDAGPAPSRSSGDRQRNREVRRWAAEQGMEISERGRIPSHVVEAYDRAH
jgi:hypothetical protein